MNLNNLTSNQLIKAANIKDQIDALEKQLIDLLGGSASVAVTKAPKKGGMSAAGRARIVAAQKLRWAKIKSAKAKPGSVKAAVKASMPAKKKRTMSAAGLAAIKAAQKARWAKIKAQKAGQAKK